MESELVSDNASETDADSDSWAGAQGGSLSRVA